MTAYANLGGDSGVMAYQNGEDFITVQFKPGGKRTFYTYNNMSAGSGAIITMKNLADKGSGLNSYISTYKPGYCRRI